MPKLITEALHRLGRRAARARLEPFIGDVLTKFDAHVSHYEGNWSEDTLTFAVSAYGFRGNGTFRVEDEKVTLDVKIPLAAIAFRSVLDGADRRRLVQDYR